MSSQINIQISHIKTDLKFAYEVATRVRFCKTEQGFPTGTKETQCVRE